MMALRISISFCREVPGPCRNLQGRYQPLTYLRAAGELCLPVKGKQGQLTCELSSCFQSICRMNRKTFCFNA